MVRKSRKIEDVEKRLLSLEKEDVEKVKILGTQYNPYESLLLIFLDELDRLAREVNHKELEVYDDIYKQCGRLQGKIRMAYLCLTE